MIIVKTTKKETVISITEDFASLVKISPTGEFIYEFSFHADSKKAIKKNAYKTVISVLVEDIAKPKYTSLGKDPSSQDNINSPNDFLETILSKSSKSKDDVIKKTSQTIVKQASGDVSSKINNETTSTGNSTVKKTLTLQSKNTSNDTRLPLMSFPKSSSTTLATVPKTKESSMTLISQGKDPSIVVNAQDSITVKQSTTGTSSKKVYSSFSSNSQETKLANTLLNASSTTIVSDNSNISSEVLIPVLVSTKTSEVKIVKQINIGKILQSEFFVRFELFDKSGEKIDTITSKVLHSQQISIYNRPTVPPIVKVSQSNSLGKRVLNISQKDHKAKKVLVYKKVVSKTDFSKKDYSQVSEIDLGSSQGFISYPVYIDSTSATIFRCIPVGADNSISSEFTNVVFKPIKVADYQSSDKFLTVSLTTKLVLGGIVVELNGLPHGVVSANILRRDRTIKDKSFSFVNGVAPILVNNQTAFPVEILDTFDLKSKHIYEYSCDLVFKGGEVFKNIKNSFVEYIPISEDLVNTRVGNVKKIEFADGVDVSFDLASTIVKNKLDDFKKLLEQSDLLDFYKESISKEKNEFKELIAYKIERINLTTGEDEDFGIFVGEAFSDAELRKVSGVKPLIPGNDYRYEIYAILRTQETLLEKFNRKVNKNNRVYQFQPSKFLHPLALEEGNLSTPTTRLQNYGRDELTFGKLGNITFVNVSIPKIFPEIIQQRAERVSSKFVLVQWKLSNNFKEIDHFLISKDLNRVKTFIGKSHTVSTSNTYEFLDPIDSFDIGTCNYYIRPIYNDYAPGPEVETNTLVIT